MACEGLHVPQGRLLIARDVKCRVADPVMSNARLSPEQRDGRRSAFKLLTSSYYYFVNISTFAERKIP